MIIITGNGRENGYTPAVFMGSAYGQVMYEPMAVATSQNNCRSFDNRFDRRILSYMKRYILFITMVLTILDIII